MVKSIAIIALGYAWLPNEKGPSRFYYIAKTFAEAGYDVELIGSDFQHFEKKKRNLEQLNVEQYPFRNVFIHVPPYKKNIDVRRIWSNHIAKRNVSKYLNSSKNYDAIYCAIPANSVAAGVAAYCNRTGTPFIVDIEDLWPEAMKMVMDIPIVSNILYYPMKNDARKVYKTANAVIGTSQDYTDRVFKDRKNDIESATVYVGCDIGSFDSGVEKNIGEVYKPKEEFWVSYAGSIGISYDIETLIKSAKVIEDKGYSNIKFKIMGTGPLLENMRSLSKELGVSNVVLMGYMEYPKMAAYLKMSDVVINSFVKGAPQSIVNKIGDYLASESAMINTLENPEFTKLVKDDNFGINIEPENIVAMTDAIEKLYMNKKVTEQLGINARKCAETKFDRAISYKKIVSVVDDVICMKKFDTVME